MSELPDPRSAHYRKEFDEHRVNWSCGLNLPAQVEHGMLGASDPSLTLLAAMDATNVHLPPAPERQEVERLLRRAMWAEYDAECLCKEIDLRVADGRLQLSASFREFERLWRRDELDHALGFIKLYSILFGTDETAELETLSKRTGDFTKLDRLFTDELSLALVIAYDEIATTRSYAIDAKEFYPHFGFAGLVPWIRRLAGDEGRHFANCISVIRKEHSHRFAEIPAILEGVVTLDMQKNPYAGTFVLDHDDDQFAPEMLEECKVRVLRALGLTNS